MHVRMTRFTSWTLIAVVVAGSGLRAETHTFTPASVVATYSASHAPSLRIKSGDRVVTKTPDGAGEVGPIYIETAEPGDLIVVSIEKLDPASTVGTSASFMATNAFDPGGLSNRSAAPVQWEIDRARGVVSLDLRKVITNIDWVTRYSPPVYKLPLKPMLAS